MEEAFAIVNVIDVHDIEKFIELVKWRNVKIRITLKLGLNDFDYLSINWIRFTLSKRKNNY